MCAYSIVCTYIVRIKLLKYLFILFSIFYKTSNLVLLVSSIVTTGNTTSFVGYPLNLTCTAVIHPSVSITPTFEWIGPMLYRESTKSIGINLNNTTFQNILSIERVTESYNGTYTCYVMVDNYSNKTDYQLHIISKHYSINIIISY